MAGGLLAAWCIDLYPQGSADRSRVFATLFAVAFVAEMLSALWLARSPEPRMPPSETVYKRLWPMYRDTLRDPEFKRWIAFIGSWRFAVNLAQPFFTLFFLQQLGFSMTFVILLSLTSQLANLMTLSRWGTYADRYKNKSILNVAAPAFLLCILGMVGASQIDSRVLVWIYLVVLHLLLGTASAGVTIASSNMLMKLSPAGDAQAYIATSGLMTAVAAGLAPLLGGFCQDFFAARSFSLALEWNGPRFQGSVVQLSVQSWDFYFLISFLFGLYALHRMAFVQEKGELVRGEMLREMREQSLIRRALADGVAAMGNLQADLVGRARKRRARKA
jgi:MFS family permease